MNSIVLPLLLGGQQAAGTAAQSGPMGGLMSFAPFILIIGIFYFLIIRPQNKKRKETEKMLSALKKGDKIVTIGGIHGTIQSAKESTVVVRVDDNTRIEFSRSAISTVQPAAREEKAALPAEKIEDGETKTEEAANGESK
jgi:preprotein translocase subunit YajC